MSTSTLLSPLRRSHAEVVSTDAKASAELDVDADTRRVPRPRLSVLLRAPRHLHLHRYHVKDILLRRQGTRVARRLPYPGWQRDWRGDCGGDADGASNGTVFDPRHACVGEWKEAVWAAVSQWTIFSCLFGPYASPMPTNQ